MAHRGGKNCWKVALFDFMVQNKQKKVIPSATSHVQKLGLILLTFLAHLQLMDSPRFCQLTAAQEGKEWDENIFCRDGWDGMEVLWVQCGTLIKLDGTVGDGNKICGTSGDQSNFCPRTGLYCFLALSQTSMYAYTKIIIITTRMWANAQPDGRPAEHRWRPLFNAAKFS